MLLPQICLELKLKLERTDFRSCKWITKEVQRCIHVFTNYKGAFLTPEEYNGLIDLLKVTLETFTQDKQARLDQMKSMKKKLDEEDVEALMESIEKMDKVWTYCMDISGVLLQAMPAETSPLI